MTKLTYTISFLSLMVCHAGLYAGERTIKGIIKKAETELPIEFAKIVLYNTSIQTTSAKDGTFRINMPDNSEQTKIIISHVGYNSDTIFMDNLTESLIVHLKESTETLAEIVITGNTKAIRAKENPIPIVAVSAKKIELSTETNVIDALVKNVPGLQAVKTGPNISKPFIRGLGYNRVLTLFDGLRQEGQQWGDEHGIEVDAYNIGKAEVLKGPASLLYGSDALAGVVHLLPYSPKIFDGKIHGRYLSEYQSNNGLMGNGINVSMANHHWEISGSGSYRIAKNYQNKIDKRVYNTGFREKNALLSIKHKNTGGYSKITGTFYDNLQGIPDGSRDSLSRKFTKQINEGALDQIKERPVVSEEELNSYALSPLHQHIQHYRIFSNHQYDIGKGNVDAQFAWQQNIRREYNHPTQPQQAGMFVRLNTINYNLNYTTPTILQIHITIGLNGMYQNNKNKDATDFPIPDYNLWDQGGFVFATWKNDRWVVTGGLRHDLRLLRADNFYIKNNPKNGFEQQGNLQDSLISRLQFPAIQQQFHGSSMSLGTTYKLSGTTTLKANIARGYRAPSITEYASNGLDPGAHIIYLGNRSFQPEFSLQEDFGLDWETKQISGNISVFNNNIKNYIYLSLQTDGQGNPIVNAQGDKTYQYQQAKAQLYGIEAFVSYHPTALPGFVLDNSFSLIYGFNRKADYEHSGIQGNYLPLIPPAKWFSSINKEFKTGLKTVSSFSVKAEGEFNATQNRYLALNNTESSSPAYAIFNFGANCNINFSKKTAVRLIFQVNNAFDKSYQSNMSRLKYFEYYNQSPNGHTGIWSMGRNLAIKAIFEW